MRGVRRVGLVAGLMALALAPAVTAQGAAAPSADDQRFLQTIHQANLFEIKAGNMARQKGTDSDVKDLGGKFATDHKSLDKQVQDTASKVGVSLPGSPSTDQQAILNQLNGLSGSEFDKQWVSTQLTAHDQTLQLAQTEATQGSDESVKKVADMAIPMLQAHRDALAALANKLGIPVPGASSGTPSPGATSRTPSPGATSRTPSPGATSGTPSPGGTGATASVPGIPSVPSAPGVPVPAPSVS